MKRKQRKAQKKAEVEQQKQRAELERREQGKTKATDGELDGPKEEELIPDKLARVGAPLTALFFLLMIVGVKYCHNGGNVLAMTDKSIVKNLIRMQKTNVEW